MQTGLRIALAAGLASTLLVACGQKATDSAPLPDIPATVPSTAPLPVVSARPASGTTIASAPAGTDVAGETAIAGGAETSGSKSTGPGNGSTAVGGVAGGQK